MLIARQLFHAAYRVVIGLYVLNLVREGIASTDDSYRFDWITQFTILSNIIGGLVFLAGAVLVFLPAQARWFDLVRGAALTCLAVTAGVSIAMGYNFSGDFMMYHVWMPLAAVADWLLDPPVRLRLRWALPLWLVIPVAYTVFAMVRGAQTGDYLYSFMDPDIEGWGGVLAYLGTDLAGVVIVSVVFVLLGNVLGGLYGVTTRGRGSAAMPPPIPQDRYAAPQVPR